VTLEQLRARRQELLDELRAIDTEAGDAALTPEQQTRFDAALAERQTVEAQIASEERRAEVRASLGAPGVREGGDGTRGAGPALHVQRDPREQLIDARGVPTHAALSMPERQRAQAFREALTRAVSEEHDIDDARAERDFERILRRHSSDTAWAANLLARSRPEYESGWAKLMLGRAELLTEEERAALVVGTNANGGYLVPTHLDPTLILTNDGAGGDIREISRVVTLTVGDTWNGATTAGVTASYDAELAEVSDDTPTVGQPSIPTHKAQSLVQASIEAFQDIGGLESDVRALFADAKERLQSEVHATGTGTNQPTGIFTALDANTNVELTSTTAATIGTVDLRTVYRSVPKRWRRRSTWLMNPLYSLAIKDLGTAVSSAYSGDLREAPAGVIMGRPVAESDDAPDTQTTTVRDNELILGDFSNYVIVEKPGSMAIEFVPHLFHTDNNLPKGVRGWYAYWRDGADSVNDLAFRLLQDKTSA